MPTRIMMVSVLAAIVVALAGCNAPPINGGRN
jgi:hypothetical protein